MPVLNCLSCGKVFGTSFSEAKYCSRRCANTRRPYRDLRGQKFGLLTAVRLARRGNHGLNRKRAAWLCACDCGKNIEVITESLTSGNTKSCGCLRAKWAIGQGNAKHGQSRVIGGRASEYEIWNQMIQRCNNPRTKSWKNYGGRGISVCERWRTFENFLADMGRRLTPNLSIDRINNDGDYEPSNCRWATRAEQNRNQRKRQYSEGAIAKITRNLPHMRGLHDCPS